MVSHHQLQHPPPPTDLALAARRPSSVSSRSTARRHRSSRSYHGGQSHRPQNEFPNFAATGDVEIVIQADGQERRYMLHRLILTQCSGFFEASTSEGWSRAQAVDVSRDQSGALARIGEEDEGREIRRPPTELKQVSRYELDWGSGQDDTPMLVQKPPQSSLFGSGHQSMPPPPIPQRPPPQSFFRNQPAMQSAAHISSRQDIHASQDQTLLTDYDNLFRIFYNYAPSLDNVNIATTYLQCKSLLTLADMYDALEVVGPRIDHHLLQFQSRLWKQIAKYPPSYLKLGYLARSKVIFSEALIHVVGQWPAGSRQLSHSIPEAVLDLIEDKVDELAEKKAKAEAQLFKVALLTSRGERISPMNGYTEWLALSLWRQYLSDQTSPPPPGPPKPQNTAPASARHRVPAPQPQTQPPPQSQIPTPSSAFYRALSAGGQAYLAHDECKKFIRLAPLPEREASTREALKRFERKLDDIKAQAREIVRPLMRSFLELDVGGGGPGYLTCTKIEDTEWPWD